MSHVARRIIYIVGKEKLRTIKTWGPREINDVTVDSTVKAYLEVLMGRGITAVPFLNEMFVLLFAGYLEMFFDV